MEQEARLYVNIYSIYFIQLIYGLNKIRLDASYTKKQD